MPAVKFRSGNYLIPGELNPLSGDRLQVKFPYNPGILAEIKSYDGAKWNPDGKFWTIKDNSRNRFQLEYLLGGDPYAWYDQDLIEYTSTRDLRGHQLNMVRQGITYRRTILAAEMGTGKSLSAIEIIEFAQADFTEKYPGQKFEAYWIAPKSALRSVELELIKWKSKVKPELYTYDSLKRLIEKWPAGKKAPYIVISDESSRVKTPTAQRSQAMFELGEGVRKDWRRGNIVDGFVIEMSGTPAPKEPADWWMQCEIAQPGFLKEGTHAKCKARLSLSLMKESITGGSYPHHITFLDDERKCGVCGNFAAHASHNVNAAMFGEQYHSYVKSVNEVELLYKRMKGLVLVIFKKDCLDLPDKQYEIIRCKPSATVVRAASIITAKSPRVITAMTLLRELSDGFQYDKEETGTSKCSVCRGEGSIEAPVGEGAETYIEITEENKEEYAETGLEVGDILPVANSNPEQVDATHIIGCPNCGGSGEITNYTKTAVQVATPKEEIVKELLDRYDDVGRTVFFAGFSGSIDRVESIIRSQKWETIRVDGRGWSCSIPGITSPLDMLRLFQDGQRKHPRVAFIAHPGSGGMGLTLTASPVIVFYSNDFNAESRLQAEDRCHRLGMDVNRGCTIIDIIHLPTDELVLENLKRKRKLQSMTMGDVSAIMSAKGERLH